MNIYTWTLLPFVPYGFSGAGGGGRGALSTPTESTIFRVYPRGDEVPGQYIRNEMSVRPFCAATRAGTLMRGVARAYVCVRYGLVFGVNGLDTRSFPIPVSRPVAELQREGGRGPRGEVGGKGRRER